MPEHQQRATEPLSRTVDQLKNTTTNMRGFADSVDHLLSAVEEFFPFIEKLADSNSQLQQAIARHQRFHRRF
ncbi:MAG: hypothetical protein IKM15_04510 [Peptococcaceae bacterium]|nr:hypothetical protein [Peptococcaceae bacterium]